MTKCILQCKNTNDVQGNPWLCVASCNLRRLKHQISHVFLKRCE